MEKISRLKDAVEITKVDNATYIFSCCQRNWRLSETAYNIIKLLDGERTISEIKAEFDEQSGSDIPVSVIEKIVAFLLENKLLDGTDDIQKVNGKRNKFLWGRITLIPEGIVNRLWIFTVFFKTEVLLVAGVFLLPWICYLFVSNKVLDIFYNFYAVDIYYIVRVYVFIIPIALFHELGHSSALLKGGQRAGRIGAAVYFVMPVLFSDVTSVWKLERKKRILVDFGGIYFQAIGSFVLFLLNTFIFRNSFLEVAILVSMVQIVSNLNPFIKLDGYWIMNDYFGTSDLTSLVKNAIFSVFTKKKVKEIEDMSTMRRSIMYCYVFSTIVFLIYFTRLLFISCVNAYVLFINDISHTDFEKISVAGAVNYIGNNIMNFIVVFFSLRMLFMLLHSIINRIRQRNV